MLREHDRVLTLIPARGGSKRLPGKNIKPFCGEPLIVHSIRCAQQANLVPMVSTDDPAIAEVARSSGAIVPFLRPDDLATDAASSVDVAVHFLRSMHAEYDTLLLLQPTSPLRTVGDIIGSLDLYHRNSVEAVVSVYHLEVKPTLVLGVKAHLLSPMFNAADVDSLCVVDGSVYVINVAVLEEQRTFFPKKAMPYVMPHERSIDIDTDEDFRRAERLFLQQRRCGDVPGQVHS